MNKDPETEQENQPLDQGDQTGELDSKKSWQDSALEAVSNKIKDAHICPACGEPKIILEGRVIGLLMGTSSKDRKANKQLPSIMLNCNNCGYARLFIAEALGVDLSSLGDEEKTDG